MKILVISLASETARRARMTKLLGGLGVDFQFVEGVVGSSLSEHDLEQFRYRSNWGLSRPEVGCLIAHSNAWKIVTSHKEESTLVLEDDVHFSSDFVEVIHSLNVDQVGLNVYRLETMLTIVDAATKIEQTIGKRRVSALHSLHVGCAGYILNRNAAKFLLEKLPEMKHPVDIEVFSKQVGVAANFNIYQVIPGCIIQDQFCSEERKVGLGSSLDLLRQKEKPKKRQKSKSTLVLFLKNQFKVRYLQLYSLFKSQKGTKRIFVDFDG
jgi:glycosyl transferase, family 25